METGEIRCSHRRTTPNFRLRGLFTRPHRPSKGFRCRHSGSAVTTVGTVLRSLPCASTMETGEIRCSHRRTTPNFWMRGLFARPHRPSEGFWCQHSGSAVTTVGTVGMRLSRRVDDGNGRNPMFPSSNDAGFLHAGFICPSASPVRRVLVSTQRFGRDGCRHRQYAVFRASPRHSRMSTFRHRRGRVGTSVGDPALRGRCRRLMRRPCNGDFRVDT